MTFLFTDLQGCVVIVMLTRLQDNGLQMCHRYWPEEGSEQYHIFEVIHMLTLTVATLRFMIGYTFLIISQ